MLVVITGPDGAGKSTLGSAVSERMEAVLAARLGTSLKENVTKKNVTTVSVWDSLQSSSFFPSKAEATRYLSDLDGYTRTLFIYHALSRSIDLGRRKGTPLLLVEGFWYKYAVTEVGHGVSWEEAVSAAKGFIQPDLTFCLDIDPGIALSRKKSGVSHYEKSGDFVQFQESLTPLWARMENEFGPWIHPDSRLPPEDLMSGVCHEILVRL